jgi:hypothetical protein
MKIPVEGGLNNPYALYLDELRDRLYVGEYGGKRILVFDNVVNVAAVFKRKTIVEC